MMDDWPAPEVPARPATDGEMPRAAKLAQRRAESAGWSVMATYARGTRPTGTANKPGAVVDSIALRLRRGRERAVAVWTDGAFDFAVHTAVGTLGTLRKVNATQLRGLLS